MIKKTDTDLSIIEETACTEAANTQNEHKISSADTIKILKTEHPLFPVYIDGSYDYIDINGNIVTDYNFEEAEFFRGGRASVKIYK